MKKRLLAAGFSILLICPAIGLSATGIVERSGPLTLRPESIPFKKEEPDAQKAGQHSFLILAALLAVTVAGMYLVRKRFPHIVPGFAKEGPERRLKLIETLRMSPKITLFLVELDGQSILLVQSGDTVQRVDRKSGNVESKQWAGEA